MHANTADSTRNDFKQKIKTWFQNKGIVNKLELYLKSQMIAEFQSDCGHAINPTETIALSPKIQAVKLLIADFLLQEDLLFSLSVFCSEVPFLLNLSYYSNYVLRLAEPTRNNYHASAKESKPRFSEADFSAILEALSFNTNDNDKNILHEFYETGNFGSLLCCLLCTLPTVMKKYRNVESRLIKSGKNEKYFRKQLKAERGKVKRMYTVLQSAYGVVEKHRNEMKDVIAMQNELKRDSIAIEQKSTELLKKEAELMTWHKALELKENSLEKTYRSRMDEVEKRFNVLETQAYELQSKYEMLQSERIQLEVDKKHFEELKPKAPALESDEMIRLQEYEQKFRLLQEEVEVMKKYNVEQNQKKASVVDQTSRDVQCTYDTLHQSQQTEIDVFINMEEYVNLMEKENSILKLSSNKQRYYINQLTSEIIFLKNKLDYLESEVKIRCELQRDTDVQSVAHKLYFPKKHWHSEELHKRKTRTSISHLHPSRRRLFPDTKTIQGSESSSGTSRDTNVTDGIVADAITEVEKLENESETLDRNFKNLEKLISRNIAFNEDRLFGSGSVSDSSPSERLRRFSQLSRHSDDADSSNVSPNAKESPPLKSSVEGVAAKTSSFHRMFSRYRRDRAGTETNELERPSEGADSFPAFSVSSRQRVTKEKVLANAESTGRNVLAGDDVDKVNQLCIVDDRTEDADFRGSRNNMEPEVRLVNEVAESSEGVGNAASVKLATGDVARSFDEDAIGGFPSGNTDGDGEFPEPNLGLVDSESTSKSDIVISAGSVDAPDSSDFWK